MSKSYATHVFIHLHFLLFPGSSCQKQILTLLQYRQRPQLQLSNAELPERGVRSVAAPFWVTISKRGLKHLPLKKLSEIVLFLVLFRGGKYRLHAPTVQMTLAYIQQTLNFQWLWRKSRWMWRRYLSRVWCQSNRKTRTVSTLGLRGRIPQHHQKT